MFVIEKIILSFLFCIIYSCFLEKQVSNQENAIFFIAAFPVRFYPASVPAGDNMISK